MALKIAPADIATRAADRVPPQRFAMRSLWRLCGWGGAAAVALTAVALVSQTEVGEKRIRLALAAQPDRVLAAADIPAQSPAAAPANDAELRRLAAAVRSLTADRDRLNARVAGLERNLDDMTGSIKAVEQATVATQAAKVPVRERTAAPAVGAPKTAAPQAAESQTAQPKAVTPLVSTAPLAFAPVAHETNAAVQSAAAAPPVEVLVPLPPVRIASAEPSEAAAATSAAPLPPKHEYGIDLGGAGTVEALGTQWAAVKANFGPLLAGLHPIASVRQRRPIGVDYRLIVGPLPSVASAARLCARFIAVRVSCHAAKFEGEQLAER
jgi:hypothetical protein